MPIPSIGAGNYTVYYFVDSSAVPGNIIAAVGSLSSGIGWIAMPLFLVFYSYRVARDVLADKPSIKELKKTNGVDPLVHSLLKGSWQDLFLWVQWSVSGNKTSKKRSAFMAVHRAAGGLILAFFFV